MTTPETRQRRFRTRLARVASYLGLLVAGILGFLAIQYFGEGGSAQVQATVAAKANTHGLDVVFHVLATLSAVVGLGYLLGKAFRYLGQPPVIGEVMAGIFLGPSVLGAISPDLMHQLIPTVDVDPHGQVSSALKMIAQLGVILYMFVVGLELNGNKIKNHIHSAVAISHASIIVPFLLGSWLALWLHQSFAPEGISFTSFALFLGVAMSITAFPVLARILTDRGMESTRLGTIALACAAADDATAWCLLALVVGIVQTQIQDAIAVMLWSITFIATMIFVVKPFAKRLCYQLDRGREALPESSIVLAIVAALLCALTTEVIGIHAIFGAFLLGAIIPHDSRLAQSLNKYLRDSVTVLLLPAFFAYTGMRTQIGLVSGWENILICVAIIAVATIGKFGGTFAAARYAGINSRNSAALGILMNTRGLMELIVLNIGLDLGVISPTLFAMMVIMAITTTIATSPILSRLIPKAQLEAEAGESEGLHEPGQTVAAG